MNDRRLTFFSFVAILSAMREPTSGTVSVTALSPEYCPGKYLQCNPSRSCVPYSTCGAKGGVAKCFTTSKSRRSISTLYMATSSSDLKNVIETTKKTAVLENKTVTKKKTEATKESVKKDEKKSKGISNNVVSRLARAAKEAAEAKRKKNTEKDPKNTNTSGRSTEINNIEYDPPYEDDAYMFDDDEDTHENQSGLSSITKLSSVIDQELLKPNDGYKPARETDSIRLLLEHNNDQKQSTSRPALSKKSIISPSSTTSSSSNLSKNGIIADKDMTPKDVAIVFGRPLCDGEITIEYAARLVSLAKAMKYEGYKPSLVCFCGPSSLPQVSTTASASTTKQPSVPSIGVEFFRHLCSINDISLEGTDLCRVPSLSSTSTTRRNKSHKDKYDDSFLGSFSSSSFSSSWSIFSLSPVVKKLLGKHYFEKWLEESEAYESDMDEYGMTRQEPRKKIHIHWKLFSTEYHLCNLNDIHIRSPRQSPLARLMHDLEQAVNSEDYRRGIVQTTWSFHYSIYPYVMSSSKEKMKEAFLGKCYLMAQSLVPLLVNLKGVAENSEFFQRDNYRTLVATRRSLATLLEQMNEAYRNNRERQTATMVIPPTLKAQLKKQTSGGSSTTLSSIEIHLECALLSLGRCCDLVRPAGTFSEQSVSRQEWKDALNHLQEFMDRIECSCDPDRPVPADKRDEKITENRSVMELLL